MPGVGDLPIRKEMPDVMVKNDGTKVSTVAQWDLRRDEIKRLLEYYAIGLMPPSPRNVRGREIASQTVLGGTVQYRLVHLSFGPDGRFGWDLGVFVPIDRAPPFPTVIFPSEAFDALPGAEPLPRLPRPPGQGHGVDALLPLTAAPQPPGGRFPRHPVDANALAQGHRELFSRGYALVTYCYQDPGEDDTLRNPDGSWAFRTTRYYPAYPGYDWGLVAGWAWGISRIVDYLEEEPFADKAKLMAIGHSRLGKAVMVAGAFDERLALVCPAGSGAGGTGAFRFNGAGRGGTEGLEDMMRKYPNWFSSHLHEFWGHVDKLPFDEHWFLALVAPRAIVSLEGVEDQNCVPNALKQAVRGAQPAFALYGATDRIGVNYANHRHDLTPEDWSAALDFADKALRGLKVERPFDRFPSDPPQGTPERPPAR